MESPTTLPKPSKLERFQGMPKELTSLLEAESDRGAILILATYLEEILGLIISGFSTTEKLAEELLDVRGPAGSFSYKIQICETFGLISSDESAALNCLRKIRNSAAHFDHKGRGFKVLFDSPQTRDQVNVFLGHLNLSLKTKNAEAVRRAFIAAGRLLASKLTIRLAMVPPAKIAKTGRELATESKARLKDSPIGKVIEEARAVGGAKGLEQLMQLLHFMKMEMDRVKPET